MNTAESPADPGETMLIDCTTCVARDIACGDCVVTVLLGRPPLPVDLDADERDALGTLAVAGLVPPLRLVQALGPPGGALPESA